MNPSHTAAAGASAATYGGSPSASSTFSLAAAKAQRTSPFSQTAVSSSTDGMAPSALHPGSQPFRPAGSGTHSPPHPLSLSIRSTQSAFERNLSLAGSGVYASNSTGAVQAIIHNLPADSNEQTVRLICAFSQDLLNVELLPIQDSDDELRSAIVNFRTMRGAKEAKHALDGKTSITEDASLAVDIMGDSPVSGRSIGSEKSLGTSTSIHHYSQQSLPPHRSRQNSTQASSSLSNSYGDGAFGRNTNSRQYQNFIFSPQSPIGNHLIGQTGASMINNDRADDYETEGLLSDPLRFAESGDFRDQRRATEPHVLTRGLSGLSLSSLGHNDGYTPQSTSYSTASNMRSHAGQVNVSGMPQMSFNDSAASGTPPAYFSAMGGPSQSGRQNYPPVNPNDQHPPCNTLYVGNLPNDTIEEELKSLFSRQRGYKRMLYRVHSQSGPMGFVEFENTSLATKALYNLYGTMLSNSVRGGIRLSFSKNPLGVRNGQTGAGSPIGSQGAPVGFSNPNYGTTNGLPPGLHAPPGLASNRMAAAAAAPSGNTYATSPYLNSRDVWAPYGNGPSNSPNTYNGFEGFQGQY